MSTVLNKIAWSFWRLLPANPILVRVVSSASKRVRHLWLRAGYLVLLAAVVLLSLMTFMGDASGLNELAKGASQTFKYAATLQLGLMCFLAPVFTAGAITQERDAQTYNILLSTPLTNAQIVLGSLLSRLYFVVMLLVAGLPIFFTTMVYGGVTTAQIVESFGLSAATAVLTGALAIFISVVRIGTRRTIFSFYMTIALYLLAVYLLGQWGRTWSADAPPNVEGQRMSVLAPLHPFLALEVSLNRVTAPDYALVAGHGAIVGRALAYPAAAYITWTLVVGVLLTVASMFFVRSGARQGEPTIWSRLRAGVTRRADEERRRKPRHVWSNPVAWREAKTKSSGGAGGLLRWFLLIGGALAAVGLLFLHLTDSKALPVRTTQEWLGAVLMIEFTIALLIATNTAATSMTKEKESKSMEVLLTTPLTSQYIIWGKLRGLVSFAAPLIAVPVGSLLLFGLVGLIPRGKEPLAWVELAVELGAVLVMYVALSCVVCLKFSLTSRKTVKATMMSIAFMLVLAGALSAIFFPILGAPDGHIGAFFAPWTPYTAIHAMTQPVVLTDGDFSRLSANAPSLRVAFFMGSAIAAGIYALIVFSLYKALVRGFDMIVRKQTAT
ncbi:MAG: hypothetical protein BroJett003_19000 [Planctomycetota bacterium]|nr:MAG: hypothetical protein BroJett003_19000 [Planctomycetota bacterium]